MEELIKIANIYYKSSSPAMRDAAHKFFKAIDHDNDRKVCLHESLGFMRDEGHAKLSSRHFFKSLDRNRSGTLDFMGVMTLYYIIQSGRPFCYECDDFIPGMCTQHHPLPLPNFQHPHPHPHPMLLFLINPPTTG
ncbi:hypothetical protein RHSIM_Rhsim09G0015400 [Rhododendron simsii]|uniref:EF-hand domain-containing protein n=1 Tax=Rhododendron simsii TaxID=118357 RepID=A0A834LDC5_RHOSS|nr:hypothetical protein RHSIM_Rhsim09G0015400 [Rhododendron simsii]